MKKQKSFQPMLAPNQSVNLDELNYGLLASTKIDGCRMLSYKSKLVTRSLKPVQNKQLNEKFEPIRLRTEKEITLMDGEIYAEGVPFQMIVSCFMIQDYTAKSAIKKWQILCDEHELDITREETLDKLKFYVFDCVVDENYNKQFWDRVIDAQNLAEEFPNLVVMVKQHIVDSSNEVRTMFRKVLNKGYEGLILKDPNGRYKFGRGTIKEGLIYKVKPYVTLDAQIIGVKQATVVNPNAPKTVNELGRSVTSKKKEDRICIQRAKTFTIIYKADCNDSCTDDFEVDIGIGGTEKERDEIWVNKKSYIGRWIEYKGMIVGSKDVPRHAQFIRYREDKDET